MELFRLTRLLSFCFPRSPNCTPRFITGVFAVIEYPNAIHENVFHADGVLMRLFERGAVRDCLRIEDGNIGEHSFFEEAATIEAEIGGG